MSLADRIQNLNKIFFHEKELLALPEDLKLIYRPDYTSAWATRTMNGYHRIQMPGWIVKKGYYQALSWLLHELAHHSVGLHHQHDETFKAEEQRLHAKYGLVTGPYERKASNGEVAYFNYIALAITPDDKMDFKLS